MLAILNALVILALASLVRAAYRPSSGSCSGNTDFTRSGGAISSAESSYISGKQAKSNAALKALLSHVNVPGLDTNQAANIALAFSGGGYRSMLTGAGAVSALDSRNEAANTLGGLLQSANYMTGASGGGWLVGTLAMNDFPAIADVRANSRLWQLKDNIPTITNPFSWTAFGTYGAIITEALGKRLAGFRISFTDEWGLLVGRRIVDSQGTYSKWSEITGANSYQSNDMPFPIIVATALDSGTQKASDIIFSNPLLEITPIEFGSYDKAINAFVTTGQLGTKLDNGAVSGNCVSGFDDAHFLLGTTSSLFQGTSGWATTALRLVGFANGNSAPGGIYSPNPFNNFDGVSAPFNGDTLFAADGGYSHMGIPLWPLLQPSRKLDLVLAFDGDGAPPGNTPDGKTLTATKQKVELEMGPGVFPNVPTSDEYLANYLSKPLWIGCDVSKLNKIPGTDRYVPLVVDMPNHDVNYNTLQKTVKLDYTSAEQDGMIGNGFEVASLSGSLEWAQCIGCATVLREYQRSGKDLPETCKKCMTQYCYN